MSNENNSNERETLVLEFPERQEFSGTIKQQYLTTTKLCRMINRIFNNVFKDYNGCVIRPGDVAKGEPEVVLILDFIPGSNNGNTDISAFVKRGSDVSKKSNGAMDSRVAALLAYNTVNVSTGFYEITQDAVDMLADYATMRVANNKPNKGMFMQRVAERPERNWTGYGQTEVVHTTLDCIDINRIIGSIMEESSEKGDKFYYQVSPVRPIYMGTAGQNLPQPSTNYLYGITQLSRKDLNEIMEELGVIANVNMSVVNTQV